jgi:glyoxylase-like metal-dependent hydrolase (beta-lactamase superfamily II)
MASHLRKEPKSVLQREVQAMLKTEVHGAVTIFRLSGTLLGQSVYDTAAYLVGGLLVDSGSIRTSGELSAALVGRRPDVIVCTHSHEDHIGGISRLQREHATPTLAHSQCVPIIEDPSRQYLHLYRLLVWGRPRPAHAMPAPETIETATHEFRVIPTPGHSPDHIALFEANEGWLFAGDSYVGGKDRTLRYDNNVYEIIRSLRRMQALEPAILFTGNGKVRQPAMPHLQEKIGYLEELCARVHELHDWGLTAHAIRRRLVGPELFIAYYSLGHFSGAHLIRSILHDQ